MLYSINSLRNRCSNFFKYLRLWSRRLAQDHMWVEVGLGAETSSHDSKFQVHCPGDGPLKSYWAHRKAWRLKAAHRAPPSQSSDAFSSPLLPLTFLVLSPHPSLPTSIVVGSCDFSPNFCKNILLLLKYKSKGQLKYSIIFNKSIYFLFYFWSLASLHY